MGGASRTSDCGRNGKAVKAERAGGDTLGVVTLERNGRRFCVGKDK